MHLFGADAHTRIPIAIFIHLAGQLNTLQDVLQRTQVNNVGSFLVFVYLYMHAQTHQHTLDHSKFKVSVINATETATHSQVTNV